MADTGWVFPGTAATYPNKSTIQYSNPDNAKVDDPNFAALTGSKFNDGNVPNQGVELVMTNFGFSIPTNGYVITGIETEISGSTDGNRIGEFAYLTDSAGSPPSGFIGTAKEDEWTDMDQQIGPGGSPLPRNEHIYGGRWDTWGADLTPAIVNSSTFGWVFMAYDDLAPLNSRIWYMKMKVYYERSMPTIVTIGI